MTTTRVFKSGNSQAVRIPAKFKIQSSEVEISKRGDELIISPRQKDLSDAFQLMTEMTDDFMIQGRNDTPPQERDF